MSFIHEFLSTEGNGVRYRALVLFAPFISTVIGYLVQERENSHNVITDVNAELERVNTELFSKLIDLETEQEVRLKAEKDLGLSEIKFSMLAQSLTDTIFLLDDKLRLEFISPSVSELLGYESHELISGNTPKIINRPSLMRAARAIRAYCIDYLHGGDVSSIRVDADFIHRDGRTIRTEFRLSVFLAGPDEPLRYLGMIRDITRRKHSEELLNKEVVNNIHQLKLVHHRSKNSLATLHSFLSLQARRTDDTGISEALHLAENRVLVISLLHERLYESGAATRLNAGEYLRILAKELHLSLRDKCPCVTLDLDLSPIELDEENAIPCGFILNELLTNACTHAFKNEEAGIIMVRFGMTNDGNYILSVRDTGSGLAEGFLINDADTLGLKVVSSLARQLDGSIMVERDGGTTFSVTFSERWR